MKTRLLMPFVFAGFLSLFVLIPNSDASWSVMTVDEMAKKSDAIVIGTIESTWIDVRPFDDYVIIDTAKVKVDKWLKNNKNSETLEIRYYGYWAKAIDDLRGKFISDSPLYSYESGQKVLLILDHEEHISVMGEGYYPLFEGSFVITDDDVAISQDGKQTTLQQIYETINNNVGGKPTEISPSDESKLKIESKEELSQNETVLVHVPFVEFTEDEIVNTLLSLTDDSNAKKVYQSSKKVRYETNKAEISISAPRNTGLSHYVDYNIYDKKYTIPPDQAQEFVKLLLNKIGYNTDGSEDVNVEESYHNTSIIIYQTKDGMKIANEMNRFQFKDRSTTLEIAHWYDNLDEYNIGYSKEDAKNIAYGYLTKLVDADPKLRDMNIIISYPKDAFVELKAMDNHLVYSVSRMYFYLEVQVDATTGNIVNEEMIKITGKEVPGCASVGVSKLTQQDIKKIEERVDTLLYYELTDDDLNQLPILKEMVDATNSRVEYNDRVRLPMFIDEWNEYASFFKEKFDEQHEMYYESDLKSNFVLYNDAVYTVRYNENYKDTPLQVEIFPDNFDYDRKSITITEDEIINKTPKFKESMDLMGTWEVYVSNSTGILESEQQRYQSYLSQKNIEKYGNDAEQHAQIFSYNGNYYEPSFVIC